MNSNSIIPQTTEISSDPVLGLARGFLLSRCPRCGYPLTLESDEYGPFEDCIACGYNNDLQQEEVKPPAPATGKQGWHVIKVRNNRLK